jgi:hypothetical protein
MVANSTSENLPLKKSLAHFPLKIYELNSQHSLNQNAVTFTG